MSTGLRARTLLPPHKQDSHPHSPSLIRATHQVRAGGLIAYRAGLARQNNGKGAGSQRGAARHLSVLWTVSVLWIIDFTSSRNRCESLRCASEVSAPTMIPADPLLDALEHPPRQQHTFTHTRVRRFVAELASVDVPRQLANGKRRKNDPRSF